MSKKHSSAFKFRVALAAIKGDKTVSDLCQEFSLAASQIYAWKKELEDRGVEIFETKNPAGEHQKEVDKLHGVIGKLKVENDFLERALASSR
ncbi:MAG: transposase [Chlamydiota bacterium]